MLLAGPVAGVRTLHRGFPFDSERNDFLAVGRMAMSISAYPSFWSKVNKKRAFGHRGIIYHLPVGYFARVGAFRMFSRIFPGEGLCTAPPESREGAAGFGMIAPFLLLKPAFPKQIVGDDYEIEYNEHLNIGLSAGIDLGTVLFEYRDGYEHPEFTGIGDPVAMAEFLMSEAGTPSNHAAQRAHLLCSPTVDRLALPWVDSRE